MPIAQANHIEIWYDTFGHTHNQPLLLIMGACAQAILWPVTFCQKLADAGFYVIRYDHRDSGFSTSVDFEKNPYNLNDMMRDAIGLLDYLKIQKFHVVGLSLGGPMSELLAVHYPDRVQSLSLISTSCDFRPLNLALAGLPVEKNSLSYPLSPYLNWMKKFLETPPKDEQEHLALRLEGWRILNGNQLPFEEEEQKAMQQQFLNRLRYPLGMTNHVRVCQNSEAIIQKIPYQVQVPTTVFHGSEDPIFPPDHGQALAQAIQNSRYIPLDGMGHILNGYFDDIMVAAITENA